MPGPGGAMGLLDMMSDQPAPPRNQAVNDVIQRQLAADPNFVGNDMFRAIQADPGLSGYFEAGFGGNITPRMMQPQQVAADAGLPNAGQLTQGIFPGDQGYGIRYGIPNDRGGFFNLDQLYRGMNRNTPSIGSGGAVGQGLSTNNWRLLGRGPGWIMRNGRYINMNDPSGWRGAAAGADTGAAGPAEGASPLPSYSNVGSGAWAGMPNNWRGAFGWPGQDTPYLYDRVPVQTNV